MNIKTIRRPGQRLNLCPAWEVRLTEATNVLGLGLNTKTGLPGMDLVFILKRGRGHVAHVAVEYRKTSTISRTLVGNNIADNSDVVGASPVGAAPTTSSFST